MKKQPKHIVESVVRWHLSSAESLGDQVGASGHLGNKKLIALKLREINETAEGFLVNFDYTIQTETEFTIYPDNPPPEINKKGTLVITESILAKYELDLTNKTIKKEIGDRRFLDSFLSDL